MNLSITPDQKEILRLRDIVSSLEEQVRGLTERLDSHEIMFPKEWCLSPQETRALRFLYTSANGFRTREGLRSVIVKSGSTDEKIVDVIICRLRKSVKNAAIVIETRMGEGYQLSAASREIIKVALVQSVQAEASAA